MTFNLIPVTRHDERLDENDADLTEYPLTKLSIKLSNLATCKTHHSNNIWGSNKKIGG